MARRKKKKGNYSKIAVAVILIQVFLYTWVHLILSAVVGVELAPVVSVAFYSFCGAEAGLLAFIKQAKLKQDEEENQ